jgi:hypothetical protein
MYETLESRLQCLQPRPYFRIKLPGTAMVPQNASFGGTMSKRQVPDRWLALVSDARV